MSIAKVIPAKRWKNTKNGRTASIYGAVPYTSSADKKNWKIETVGYTFQRSDGTVSAGPQGVIKTKKEALKRKAMLNKQAKARQKLLRG